MTPDPSASEAARALSRARWDKAPLHPPKNGRTRTASPRLAEELRRIGRESGGRKGVGAPYAIYCFALESPKPTDQPLKAYYYSRPESVLSALERYRALYALALPYRRIGTTEPPKYRVMKEEEFGEA